MTIERTRNAALSIRVLPLNDFLAAVPFRNSPESMILDIIKDCPSVMNEINDFLIKVLLVRFRYDTEHEENSPLKTDGENLLDFINTLFFKYNKEIKTHNRLLLFHSMYQLMVLNKTNVEDQGGSENTPEVYLFPTKKAIYAEVEKSSQPSEAVGD